ncbi:MAG TPA: 5'-methylthioadenosine/adenosylhomocysteine nucleosidase [Treponemataceae bacterium]|nr:5'-methylthioadenosine/adenosylhomocysteine nucleosidase [Treponemataceae bacterium]
MIHVGVIGAMKVEISYLVSVMKNIKTQKIANLVFYIGNIKNTNVVIVQSGVGKVNAAMVATLLITIFKVTHLINTGVAGGLEKGLHLFDIIISKDVVHHDMDAVAFGYKHCEVPGLNTIAFPADKKLRTLAKEAFLEGQFNKKFVEGRVATGDVFVNSAKLKKEIRERCNASCCEMEGAAVAQVAYLHKIPFVIIRAISDMAENTQEVYREEKAAECSSFLVKHMIANIIG